MNPGWLTAGGAPAHLRHLAPIALIQTSCQDTHQHAGGGRQLVLLVAA
jgi:hypothetical protein